MVTHKIILPIFRKVVNLLSGHGIGRFYPIRIALKFLVSHLKNPNAVVKVHGHKMFLDPIDTLSLSIWGIYEPLVTELFKREIKKGDVVLDIGAHIGYYTLLAAKLVGEKGKVFAFEPDPTNFGLLKRNVKTNGYKNVILVQKAISNKTEKIKLYLSKDNLGDHRIYNSHDGRQSTEIEAIRLDDYFKNRKEGVDFIKMDIQGAEGLAIKGMPLLLQGSKNVKIVMEFWPMGLRRSSIKPEECLESLVRCGFKLFNINEQKKRIEPITIHQLMQMCTGENHTNVLCENS